MINGFIFGTVVMVLGWLFTPQVRRSTSWQATVTPLASIIGSGFLIVAPLLGLLAGAWAPLAMAVIVFLAFGIGGVIRFNIRNLEPLLKDKAHPAGSMLRKLERISGFVLALAYVISIAFYLRLLAAFVLHTVEAHQTLYANLLTTFLLILIGTVGKWKGLKGLEHMETISVSVKLAIIAALMVGLAMFDVQALKTGKPGALPMEHLHPFERLRMLAGLLLIVQGFETSRYLGRSYDADLRINTMRSAQVMSGTIYLIFVIMALPLIHHMKQTVPDETAIIELAAFVSPLLPGLLVVAAVMSQFSAAVADTAGGGGLLAEASNARFSPANAYVAITAAAILLVWLADIFEIISIASRAFALYYLLQTIAAWKTTGVCCSGWRSRLERLRFGAFSMILAFVVIFGMSAES